jgi:hypothetical protein
MYIHTIQYLRVDDLPFFVPLFLDPSVISRPIQLPTSSQTLQDRKTCKLQASQSASEPCYTPGKAVLAVMDAPSPEIQIPISAQAAYGARVHVGVTIPLLALCLVPFSTRLYIRIWPVWKAGWDDFFVVVGFVSAKPDFLRYWKAFSIAS